MDGYETNTSKSLAFLYINNCLLENAMDKNF